MGWLKDAVIDIAVTVLIVLVTVNALPEWADWIILIYTPFILVLKAITFFGGIQMKKPKGADAPPVWFFHALYAINVAALLYSQWWLVGGQWVLIWLLSFLIEKPATN
ncbi:MAG: hypothetical protein AAF564_09045 [Bacteroidota bacterium]